MHKYYVNNHAQPNGDHEVHKVGCQYMPSNKTFLGLFSDCEDAVLSAKKIYLITNGCFYCSEKCHTR